MLFFYRFSKFKYITLQIPFFNLLTFKNLSITYFTIFYCFYHSKPQGFIKFSYNLKYYVLVLAFLYSLKFLSKLPFVLYLKCWKLYAFNLHFLRLLSNSNNIRWKFLLFFAIVIYLRST